MSSLFRCKRLNALSAYRRNDVNSANNLHILLPNFQFISARLLSSVEQKLKERRQSFLVSRLENSCGSSVETSKSNSRDVNIDAPDSALGLLKNYGFTGDQIIKVVRSYPRVLSPNAKTIISPKLEFLRSIGFSDSDVAKVVSSAPNILALSLNNQLIPRHHFLKSILGCDELVVKITKRSSRIFMADVENNLMYKVSFLREVGVTECGVAKLMECGPRVFSFSSATFKSAAEKVIGMGFNASSGMFVSALRAVLQMQKSKWDRKVEVYKKWGWSDFDFSSAFKKQPVCMTISEKKITKAMDFLVNKIGVNSSDIAKYPMVMLFSLEKKIIPRCSVMEVLFSKGVMTRNDASYLRVLSMSEKNFLEKIVTKHPQHVLELWNSLQEKVAP